MNFELLTKRLIRQPYYGQMRICSFLPSATEILFALGLGDSVAGVTFECDYPEQARTKPIVVETILPHGLTPAEIDEQVRQHAARGESLYRVNTDLLEQIKPDLIVTQELCDVCAVSTSHLLKSVELLSHKPTILSLTPHTLEDVWKDVESVGEATGAQQCAQLLVADARARVSKVRSNATSASPKVACLEWLQPLFNAGHWVPEMVALSGGVDVLGTVGIDSVAVSWDDVLAGDPDFLLIMPCGYNLQQTVTEFKAANLPARWNEIAAVRRNQVFAVNATAYFSRPGPRLVDGLEILNAIFQNSIQYLPPESCARLTTGAQ